MWEIQQNNYWKLEKFKKSFTEMLNDSKIDSEEARELLRKYDLEKKELLQISEEQLKLLRNQFWEELNITNIVEFIEKESNNYLETRIPDENLLFDWLNNFNDFDNNKSKIKINLKKLKKYENIPEYELNKLKVLFDKIKNLNIEEWSISYSKEKWIILELDTSWSNLYIKLDWDYIIITWQNDWNLFVEKMSIDEFEWFVRWYDKIENRRILEQLWFVWWLTFSWVLSFVIRTWISFLLWNLSFWLWTYKWYSLYKSYHLSRNESLQVLRENNNDKELVKSYLYLSQIWYITWYNNWIFETINNEKLSKEELKLKKENINHNDIQKFNLIKWLRDNWFSPKYLSNWKYELDMIWLFDKSPLIFEWNVIKFWTSYFENWKQLIFYDIKTAFEKIKKINEYIKLENEIKNSNNNEFNNNSLILENKLEKLKKEIFS